MRGLLIYSIFGSSLRGETAFSMRRAKNCSALDVLLRVISEAFLGSSTVSWRNRWLRSSMAQSKIFIGFFLQQMPHTDEKWGAMKCLSIMLSGLTMGLVLLFVVLLSQILIYSLLFQFFTPNSCCTNMSQQNKGQMNSGAFCFLSLRCLRV